jgi:heterodisulfide reductase subunit C2
MNKSDETLSDVMHITSQNPNLCYQCGKCSAGCPLRSYMDIPPNQVIRLFQLKEYDKVLQSKTIWLCAGCMTCSSRCPKNYDLAKFMDALREISLKKGIKPADKNIFKFHESFINQIKRFGRSFELGLMIEYKLRSQQLFQDVDMAPTTILKGKLNFIPHIIRNKPQIDKIFKKAEEK